MSDTSTLESTPNLERSKQQLKRLFEMLAVDKLVVVDDVYSAKTDLASIIANCRAIIASTNGNFLSGVPGMEDFEFDEDDIWPGQLSTLFETLGEPSRTQLAMNVADHADGSNDKECETSNLLRSLFDNLGITLQIFNLDEWKEKKDELIANHGSTLFLFDKDMTNNDGSADEGIKIAVQLIKTRSVAFCGVISNDFNDADEVQAWEGICETQGLGLQRDLLGILPKSKLREDLDAFVHTIKRLAISPKCTAIKQRVSELVDQSFDHAKQELDKLSIYEFEQIVFQSSYREGVWEPDTLIKIFALFQSSKYRQLAHQDNQLSTLASEVRNIVVSTPDLPMESPTDRVAAIRKLELYDESELINQNFLPLEVGDIFHKIGSQKKKILIAQPCDLMLRSEGTRGGAKLVALADVVEIPPINKKGEIEGDACFELPFFQNDNKSAWIKFARYELVPLEILDLVCFDQSGTAELSLNAIKPSLLIPSLAAAYDRSVSCVTSCLRKYQAFGTRQDMTKEEKHLLKLGLVQGTGNFAKANIQLDQKTIGFGIQRIRRVRAPLSIAILRKFSSFISRDAFEHDFTQTLDGIQMINKSKRS